MTKAPRTLLLSAALLQAIAIAGSTAEQRSRPERSAATAEHPRFDPTEDYEVRTIEGWSVLVNKRFIEHDPELCDEALKLLAAQLYQITRMVPGPAVEKLRKVKIWVEEDEGHHKCMAYHPDPDWLREHDMNPDKGGCVEVANARRFLSWTHEQPWMVLHELAHGYHDRFLPGGFHNEKLAAAFKRAMDAKLYDEVLHWDGKTVRAYAANNPMEYFAEATEAFFGSNDFYPFVRAELKKHDPHLYDLLEEIWGVE